MIYGLAALALLAFQTPLPDLPKKYLSAPPKKTSTMAKVGNVTIKASDLESYLWDWRAQEALQDLVTHQMIVNEARRLKVAVSDTAIQQELDKQLATVKAELPPGENLETSIREKGFPRSRLYLRIKSEQLLNALVLKSFSASAFVKVSTIIFRPKTELAADVAEAVRQAEDAHNALTNGEPWGDVLARYAHDASILQTGGLLGWKETVAFPSLVRQELAQHQAGAITRPAQTANGIQIFRLEAKGDTASGPVLEELKQAFLQAKRPAFLADLKKRTKITYPKL